MLLLFLISAEFCRIAAQPEVSYSERDVFVQPDSIMPDVSSSIDIIGSVDPATFKVGPGDKMFISIQGLEEITFTRWIDHEGNLYLPSAGNVNIGGMTLDKAKLAIKKLIETTFQNIEIYISLIEVRKIKVGLYGNVKQPSSFVISANSRLSDLLEHSKGLQKTSDIRNITIKHRDGSIEKVDLLKYLRAGDKTHNPQLLDDDFIFISKVDKSFRIDGEIVFPGVYEFHKYDNLLEVISLAGGLTNAARLDSIEIIRFAHDNKTQFNIFYAYDEITSDIPIFNKDVIVIRQLPDYLLETVVYIEGYVKYPGIYNIVEDQTTLADIIEEAGGFLEDASLVDAKLIRDEESEIRDLEFERLKNMERADMSDDEYDYFKAKSRERKGQVVVNFDDLFIDGDLSEDIYLRRFDKIIIPRKTDYINIIGQVVFPGKVPFDRTLTVADYIEIVGGFSWRAVEDDIRIIKANTGEWIDSKDEGAVLEAGDTIWVPEEGEGPEFWEIFRDSLFVLGQIATVVAAMVAVIASS
jgi:protein involved in polysaccharide export with SLBB domain